MRTKKYFYLLILALTFSAFVSGGCGDNSSSLIDSSSKPAYDSLLNGTWEIVSGDVHIYNLNLSADYVQDSASAGIFNITVTKNASNDKFTLTLEGDGVYVQDNTTSITAEFLCSNYDQQETMAQMILNSLNYMPIILGNDSYSKVTSQDCLEVYTYPIAEGHTSVFRIEDGDEDTLYWESEGNTNYLIIMERVLDDEYEYE